MPTKKTTRRKSSKPNSDFTRSICCAIRMLANKAECTPAASDAMYYANAVSTLVSSLETMQRMRQASRKR